MIYVLCTSNILCFQSFSNSEMFFFQALQRVFYILATETNFCFSLFQTLKHFFSGVAKSPLWYIAYRNHFIFSAVFKRKRVFCRRCKEPGQVSECWSAQDGFTGVLQSHRCSVLFKKKRPSSSINLGNLAQSSSNQCSNHIPEHQFWNDKLCDRT